MATAVRATTEGAAAAVEVGAWHEYLRETRGLSGPRYYEVEPWAWARLQVQLRKLRAAA